MIEAYTWLGSLGHTTYQVAAMVIAIAVARWVFGRRIPPAIFCLGWALVFVRLLAPAAPTSSLSPYGLWPNKGSVEAMPTSPGSSQPMPTSDLGLPIPLETSFTSVTTSAPGADLGGWFFSLWVVGFLVVLALVARRTLAFRRVVGNAQPVRDALARKMLAECKVAMGVKRHIRLRCGDSVPGPLVSGAFRPTIFIPKQLVSAMTAREWRCVFLHELAHVRRWDLAVSWLATVGVAVHWFNPFAWVAARFFRRDRELACDHLVLRRTGAESREYGASLLRVMERSTVAKGRPALIPAGSDRRDAEDRIQAIIAFRRPSISLVALATSGLLLLACALMTSPASAEDESRGAMAWDVGSNAKGWLLLADEHMAYTSAIDTRVHYRGKESRTLAATGDPQGYGTLMQTRPAHRFRNQRIRMRGMVKGANINSGGTMWMRVGANDASDKGPGSGSGTCPVRGTFDWQPCTIILDVADDVEWLQVGIDLGGTGQIWLGDLTTEVIDRAVPLPSNSTLVLQSLVNGDFETSTGAPVGWSVTGGARHEVSLAIDSDHYKDGNQSVRLEPAANYRAGYGTLIQRILARSYRGHRMRLVAYARGEGIEGRGDMWMRVQATSSPGDGPGLGAGRCELSGTFDWQRCEFVFDVSERGYSIELGAGLGGPGTLWLDAVTLEAVPKQTLLVSWKPVN